MNLTEVATKVGKVNLCKKKTEKKKKSQEFETYTDREFRK